MRYPSLIIRESLKSDSSGNSTVFVPFGASEATQSEDVRYGGILGHQLLGDYCVGLPDPLVSGTDNGKFTFELVGRPAPGTMLICSNDWGQDKSFGFMVVGTKIVAYEYISVARYQIKAATIPAALISSDKPYSIAVVVDGLVAKLYVNYELVMTCDLTAGNTKALYLLGNYQASRKKLTNCFIGEFVGLAFSGGLTFEPQDFYFKALNRDYAEAMSFVAAYGPKLLKTKDPLLQSVLISDSGILFGFNDRTFKFVARPNVAPPGIRIASVAVSDVGGLIIATTDGVEYDLGPIPQGSSQAFSWPAGQGLLHSDTENPRYVPFRFGGSILGLELGNGLVITRAAGTSNALKFNSKFTLLRTNVFNEPFQSIGTTNTWVTVPFTKLLSDIAEMAPMTTTRFTLPAGRYYALGSILAGNNVNFNSMVARLFNVTLQESIVETDRNYASYAGGSTFELNFNDVFTLLIPCELEIQFINLVASTDALNNASVNYRIASGSQIQFFKA